jgi:hypothetical protein
MPRGESFEKISNELVIGKRTAISWTKNLEPEIDASKKGLQGCSQTQVGIEG